jgi:hypothetical protein
MADMVVGASDGEERRVNESAAVKNVRPSDLDARSVHCAVGAAAASTAVGSA